jgi:hypothetical protein
MSKTLIITFEVVPEVGKYMSSQSVDLDTALKSLKIDITDGIDTRLKAVDEEMLHQYGKEEDDYVIVRGMGTLEFWGYSIDEVCEDLNIDLDELRNLGVDIRAEEHRV